MREGWEYKKLGEVCKILNGFAFKSSKYVEKGIRVIRITNVQKGSIVDNDPQYYPFEEEPNIKQYLLKDSDLLMSLTGNVGRVGILQEDLLPAALNQRVACLRISSNKLLLKYLFHLLNSDGFEKDCIFNAAGIAQKNMSTEWLKKYIVPLPPLSEQQRIVEELDLLSSIIEKKKAQLKELDSLAQSIFYDMFGDPTKWINKQLKDVTIKMGSGATPRGGNQSYKDEGVSLIRSLNVHNDSFKYEDLAHIDDLQAAQLNNVIIEENDVLLNITGASVARCCVVPSDILPARVNQHVSILRPRKEILNYVFLCHFLISNNTQRELLLLSRSKAATREALPKSILEKFLIPLPPLPLQQQFAEKVEAIEHQKEMIKQSIKEVETLFNSRMDYYFDG